jgi:hypothetical protein
MYNTDKSQGTSNKENKAQARRGTYERINKERASKTTALLILPAGDTGNEVHVRSADPPGLEPELVSEEETEEEENGYVVGDKRCGVPAVLEEDLPLGEDNDDDGPAQAPPGGVWGEFTMPWEVIGVNTLRLQALSESDTSDADTEPIEHSGDGTHVGEPVKNSG